MGRQGRRSPRSGERGLGQSVDTNTLSLRSRLRQLLSVATPLQQHAKSVVQRVLAVQLQL